MKNKTKIITIVAQAENGAIGKNNKLLWHLPNDFKHFKQHTSGWTIVMGRKTFDSIGKALPNRRNIVISQQKDLQIPSVEVASSLTAALEMCAEEEKVFIIGGASVYKQALPLSDCILLTTVHENFEADTFFPEISNQEWKCVEKTAHEKDEKHAYNYTFSTWERKI